MFYELLNELLETLVQVGMVPKDDGAGFYHYFSSIIVKFW